MQPDVSLDFEHDGGVLSKLAKFSSPPETGKPMHESRIEERGNERCHHTTEEHLPAEPLVPET